MTIRAHLERAAGHLERFTTPRPDGLPALRVLLALPALLLIAGILLVGLALNGTSSGAFHAELEAGRDPDLVAGAPQLIRTDEWNVQTVWAITQVEQGLPVTNESFPGGMDATIPQDLPRIDWSVAFRPHLLGFPIFDIDHAVALKWWVPGLALIAATYCFAVTILPRRPFLATALAVGFYLSPMFQWWYLQTTLWPVVWGFALLSTLIWALRSSTKAAPLVWAAVLAYLTVVMAMGIYVPYIVPIVLASAFTAIGAVAQAVRRGMPLAELLRRIWPIAAAGVVGSAITVFWLWEKSATVEAFLGTAYPGERLYPTGQGDALALAAALSSSFALALKAGGWLGVNSSEASTFVFIGAFLIPVVVWFTVWLRRAGKEAPWMLIGASFSMLLIFAFVFVPGWDAIAHLLFLDRSIPARLRLGVGFASFVVVVVLIAGLSKRRRPGVPLAAGSAAIFLASQIAIAVAVWIESPDALATARFWWLLAALSALAIYCFARARPVIGTTAFVLVGVVSAATVNPVYRGVLDLRETETSAAIQALDARQSGDSVWVGIGGRLTTAMLLESGVEGFNGFQGAPSDVMWDMIDPQGTYEFQWNRLAGVGWTPGEGDPVVSNPAPDQILVTFDACAAFAQEHVDFVLVDDSVQLPSDCLREVDEFEIVDGDLTIYQISTAG